MIFWKYYSRGNFLILPKLEIGENVFGGPKPEMLWTLLGVG